LGELEGRLAGKGAVRPVAQRGTGGGEFKSTTPGTNVGPAKPPAPPVKVVSEFKKTVEAAPPPAKPISETSGPVSMQPSGPVPKIETAASGSGPQDKLAATLPGVGPEVGAKPKLTTPESAPEALKMWERVIDYLETQHKVSLRGYCEFARIVKWTATELELGFSSEGRWAGESLGEKQNLDELKAILAELGMKLKVEVRLLDDAQSTATPARSLAESTRASASAERNKRETEAREHPITKHVLQTFGASIKEIKTDV